MRSARVLAQAKINVWLDVVRPRPDGYHDIFTLFHRLDLADEITVRISHEGSRALNVTGPRMPAAGLGPSEKNLAYRAAEAFHVGAEPEAAGLEEQALPLLREVMRRFERK